MPTRTRKIKQQQQQNETVSYFNSKKKEKIKYKFCWALSRNIMDVVDGLWNINTSRKIFPKTQNAKEHEESKEKITKDELKLYTIG